MKLTQALKILQSAPASAEPFEVLLVCGFTPLHLQTFLAAHLQEGMPERRVRAHAGLYGDIPGSLATAAHEEYDAVAVVLEWQDLDSRFGWRQLGGWGPEDLGDAVTEARSRARYLAEWICHAASRRIVALSTPTLPLPPAGFTATAQAGGFELELQEIVASLAASVAREPNVRVTNVPKLAATPPALDLKGELFTGFPYTLRHAAALGEMLAGAIRPPQPRKGLITDLDDTLWHGLVGEDGPAEVSWDLTRHAQLHGIYQQMLGALSRHGVLLAVASKNDPEFVAQVFERSDILIRRDRFFPFEVHWNPKSQSVARILRAWNITADGVVFVDDSPGELAEVAAAHPGMECLAFPKDDYAGAVSFFQRLRDLFGKPRLSADDSLRLDSIRSSEAFQRDTAEHNSDPDAFLSRAAAVMSVRFAKDPGDHRAWELINKTNQFNLNGVRLTEAEWQSHLNAPDTFVLTVAYRDKYANLGSIAVAAGHIQGGRIDVSTWVLSCRAFARRIEHRCLELLFDRLGADEIRLQFRPTPKNGPVREFLAGYAGEEPAAAVVISHERFLKECPPLFQSLEILSA